MLKKFADFCKEYDDVGLYREADALFDLFRTSQQSQPLNLFTPKQKIPYNTSLRAKLLTNTDISMMPNDAPKLVKIQDDKGSVKDIILLHGAKDGTLTFGEPGNLQQAPANSKEFQDWRASKGWSNYNWVACNSNGMIVDHGADQLISATGDVEVSVMTYPNGEKVIEFKQKP